MPPEKIGKYQLQGRIGRGGMGMIFKAHDPMLDRPVALKVISSEIEVTDELRARFFREAQACARLSHPNIVTVYDMGEDAGRLYIVMEFLEGDELRHFITARTMLPLEDKLSVMLQVCDGLHYAHQNGIVHRDIKPGNIFLLRNGQVKILDFAKDIFPDAADWDRGEYRACLRPMTPDGRPVVGIGRYDNLVYNCGHGHMGWTMACGTARIVSDVVAGRTPEIDIAGLTPRREVGGD
jgi:serine/threonine-protein kinase